MHGCYPLSNPHHLPQKIYNNNNNNNNNKFFQFAIK